MSNDRKSEKTKSKIDQVKKRVLPKEKMFNIKKCECKIKTYIFLINYFSFDKNCKKYLTLTKIYLRLYRRGVGEEWRE